uniref:Nodulin-related protein 1 n=1 Tax=Medicago truncatula TaxID=3880 RepID=I3SU76_MEDTR|nr:unknown [Medicago truncatula]
MDSESHKNTGSHGEEKKISTSELMVSAKIVAEAAQSSLGKGSADQKPMDKAKVAEAAGDLLDAVGQYAKLDDQKGLGQYVDKAADYLHGYHPKGHDAATTAPPSSKPDHHKGNDAEKSEGGGGGHHGLGDGLAKVAGGFFK